MRLAARLWILGALVPFLGTCAALLAAGHLFRAKLEGAVDEALLSQAAVESVSLFDGPGGKPHLHLEQTPLGEAVRRFAPAGALFGPDGRNIVRYPKGETPVTTDDVLRPGPVGAPPALVTRRGTDGERLRVLTVTVPAPSSGAPHALELAASLAQVDASVAAYRRIGLAIAAAMGAALLVLQSALARRLSGRVNRLAAHLAALREGNLEAVPPADAAHDEIGALSRVVSEATDRLRKARASQERLIAEAAHELRTPLTLMRTSIDLALRRRRDAAELVEALEETRREVDRLARLSTRLLDLAAAGRAEWDRAPGDVAGVAHEAAEAIRAEAERRHVLVEVDAPAPVTALFDAHGLRQAVDNLLANAVRHCRADGAVKVAVREADGVARVSVHDDGPGIPASERERIFEPFQRGERGATGTGLGLAIVRAIARGHGGRAYVAEGAPGATVVIEIPGARQAAEPKRLAPA